MYDLRKEQKTPMIGRGTIMYCTCMEIRACKSVTTLAMPSCVQEDGPQGLEAHISRAHDHSGQTDSDH